MAVPEYRKGFVILPNSDNAGDVVHDLAVLWADPEFGTSVSSTTRRSRATWSIRRGWAEAFRS